MESFLNLLKMLFSRLNIWKWLKVEPRDEPMDTTSCYIYVVVMIIEWDFGSAG